MRGLGVGVERDLSCVIFVTKPSSSTPAIGIGAGIRRGLARRVRGRIANTTLSRLENLDLAAG